MRRLTFLLGIIGILSLSGCYKPGEITVENRISNATINDIYWGDIYLGSDLIPGQNTADIRIRKFQEKLPSSHRITFVMTANGRSIYLETEEEFVLDEDQKLTIILDDDTPVSNPNQ